MVTTRLAGKVHLDPDAPGTVVKKYAYEDTLKYKCWGSGAGNEKIVDDFLPGLGPEIVEQWRDAQAEYARLALVSGIPLTTETISGDQIEEAGKVLGRIHSCRNTRWGSLDGSARFADAGRAFESRYRAALRLLVSVDPELAEAVRKWSTPRLESAAWPGEPTLVHGDFGPANLIDTPTGLRVVDWEHARWGHPQEDWAKIRFAARFPEPNGFGRRPRFLHLIERGWRSTAGADPPADPELADLLEVYFAICLGVFFKGRSNPRMTWLRAKMRGT